jgi:signal transduction histidine kinase
VVVCCAPLTWGLLKSPPLYILLIPIIWIALTHNMKGATCFIIGIDVALVLFLRLTAASITLVDLQLFMLTLSIVGMIMVNMAQLMRRQEALLQKVNNELRRVNEDLSNFSYALSHDLRGPLRGIDHLATWIMEDADNVLPQTSRDDLQTLRRRVLRMEALLDSTVAYMRIGRDSSPAELADIDAVVHDAIHLFTLPAGFKINYAKPLPGMRAHRAPLASVLRNLIDNALKHHHCSEGVITITAQHQRQTHQLEFCVADDGPGIPQESLTTIFEPFQTLESKDVREGSGMGLALTKKIVTQYGGSIWVESSVGKGSQFWFTWPATDVAPHPSL